MKKRFSLLLAVMTALAGTLPLSVALAQPPTPSTPAVPVATAPAPVAAQTLVDTALTQAKAHRKAVLVVFHASWCGWCHRLDDKLLNDLATSKLINDQYEVIHVDVMENGDKKTLENAGGDTLMNKWGGAKSGLPFYVFLDAHGKKLADSNVMGADKTNIGYPGAPDEIADFETLLKKTAPHLTDEDRARIVAQLKANAPKAG